MQTIKSNNKKNYVCITTFCFLDKIIVNFNIVQYSNIPSIVNAVKANTQTSVSEYTDYDIPFPQCTLVSNPDSISLSFSVMNLLYIQRRCFQNICITTSSYLLGNECYYF